jgi:hypothetical protein
MVWTGDGPVAECLLTGWCSNNMLYPKEDRTNQRLLYSCRNCDYVEEAENAKTYRNELQSAIGETGRRRPGHWLRPHAAAIRPRMPQLPRQGMRLLPEPAASLRNHHGPSSTSAFPAATSSEASSKISLIYCIP